MSGQRNPPTLPPPSPAAKLSQLLRGSLITQLISVAAKLGIADLLRDGPKTSDQLAAAVGANPGALYRVLRALASLGIFAETAHRRFTLTPLAEPLQSGVPRSLRGSAILYGERWWWQPCGELLQSVRSGRTAFELAHAMALFAYLDQHAEAAEVFNEHQANMTAQDAAAVTAAYDFTGTVKIVDVGGGHGTLAATILKAYPQMRGILFDQPSVTEGARQRLQAEGVADRCELIAGDFFEAVPGGGDAYLLKDIIHDWEDHRALAILRNCHRAMADNRAATARLLLVEKVIPPGNDPFTGKLTDITMLLVTGGLERTEAEYRALLEAAGFALRRIVPTRSPASIMEAVRA